ncbi:MAG: S8 family peptidase [Candidatus Cloacimonetes bacterium]|nr:S8 family peptidase [Candidatus Cloacimonadota bacterium]MDY0228816.1 S8/S53 family peptidase [Candidatus Cloacimonadaceae bacterium]
MRRSLMTLLILIAVSFISAETANYESGRITLKLKTDSSRSANSTGIAELDAKLRSFGMTQVSQRFESFRKSPFALQRILEIQIDPKYDALGVCNALSGHPQIEYAEPIYIDEVLDAPDDTYYIDTLNFASMQAEAAWDIHKCEDGTEPVIIAIVDTGVPWKHPDLAENIWNNIGEDANGNGYTMYHNGSAWVMDTGDLNGLDDDGNGKIDDLIGWNLIANSVGDENNDPTDPGGHGTRVAGLAGARTNNALGAAALSWNPILMPISCSYPGQTSSIYRGYEGIIYAAENGAHIVNCSWGSTGFSAAARDAIAYAQSLGIIVVAAAGNSGNAIPLYPAAYPGVVAIASLMNDGSKWSGSNYGGYVDAGAPNESVYSTAGSAGYSISTGATSYASPIGAAMLALIRSQNPSWTNAQVIKQFKATCDDINALNPTRENLLGEGKINAFSALTEIEPAQYEKLHLALFEVRAPSDANANDAVEPGESFLLNLTLRNYSDFSANAQILLSSTSPDVIINQSTINTVLPADDWLFLDEVFSISVMPGTPSQYISFMLTISSAMPILSGNTANFKILIHNGGSFVWEAKAGARNQSGTFIKNTLSGMGKQVVHGSDFPASFLSFDAVYLSFGALDTNVGRLNSPTMFYAIKNYLEAGGRIYIEGADAVGYDLTAYFPLIDGIHDGHEIIWPLLGIASASDGSTNIINHLAGQNGPTRNLLYTSSDQTNNDFIDLYEPVPIAAIAAFVEDDYGVVGIASEGAYGQRSLVFSYAMAELSDTPLGSTRQDFMISLIGFFEDDEVTLPVTLSSFQVNWQNCAILQWATASETDLLGWNIYRAEEAELATALRLNPALISPAEEASQGAQYSFADAETTAGASYYYWLEAMFYSGSSEIYGYRSLNIPFEGGEESPELQLPTLLFPAFPNPFSSQVIIPYRIRDAATVQIDIYDIRGRKIKSLKLNHQKAGSYIQGWDGLNSQGKPLPSGLYFYKMRSGNYNEIRKMIKSE